MNTPYTNTQPGAQGNGSTTGAGNASGDLKAQASELADKAKQTGMEKLDSAKSSAAVHIDTIAESTKAAASKLESDETLSGLSNYLSDMADSISNAADRLRNKDSEQLVAELRDIARQHPGLFIAGSVALGFGVARFARSHTPDETYTTAGANATAGTGLYGSPGTTGTATAYGSTTSPYAAGSTPSAYAAGATGGMSASDSTSGIDRTGAPRSGVGTGGDAVARAGVAGGESLYGNTSAGTAGSSGGSSFTSGTTGGANASGSTGSTGSGLSASPTSSAGNQTTLGTGNLAGMNSSTNQDNTTRRKS